MTFCPICKDGIMVNYSGVLICENCRFRAVEGSPNFTQSKREQRAFPSARKFKKQKQKEGILL